MESDNLGERRAFCYHLAGCLNLLYPTLNDPIPPHLIENLTVDQLPDTATALAQRYRSGLRTSGHLPPRRGIVVFSYFHEVGDVWENWCNR
jgi:hypothetical protein